MPDYTSQDYVTSGVDIDTYIDNVYGYNLPMKSPRQRHLDEGYELDQYEIGEGEEEDEEDEIALDEADEDGIEDETDEYDVDF